MEGNEDGADPGRGETRRCDYEDEYEVGGEGDKDCGREVRESEGGGEERDV